MSTEYPDKAIEEIHRVTIDDILCQEMITGEYKNIDYFPHVDLVEYITTVLSQYNTTYGSEIPDGTMEYYCVGVLSRLNRHIKFKWITDNDGDIINKHAVIPYVTWSFNSGDKNVRLAYTATYTFDPVVLDDVPSNKRPKEKKN